VVIPDMILETEAMLQKLAKALHAEMGGRVALNTVTDILNNAALMVRADQTSAIANALMSAGHLEASRFALELAKDLARELQKRAQGLKL